MPPRSEMGPQGRITRNQEIARNVAMVGINRLFPQDVIDAQGGLDRSQELLDQGTGLLMCITHFSSDDFMRSVAAVSQNKRVRQAEVLMPLGMHEDKLFPRTIARATGVDVAPIATRGTVFALKDKAPKLGTGLREYVEKSVQKIQEGGIAIVILQGGRRATLGQTDGKPLWSILDEMDDLKQAAILPVGLGLAGEQNYADRGYRMGERFRIEIGMAETLPEILAQLEGEDDYDKLSSVDDYVLGKLKLLVPPAYAGE